MSERKQGRRSAQSAEQTKCEIMRVATELFCELGYERVSLRNISEKVGVSHSLIRHHFGSKEKIWYAISDDLHNYMETYLRTVIDNIPANATPSIKLYSFSVRLLAHMLIFKQPIQLIADAVRQEEALIDYFIGTAGEIEAIVNGIADEYNNDHPDTPIKIWEIKWQMLMFAHGAASLGPFMMETWSEETDDYQRCLLNHWQMFNSIMAARFNVPHSDILSPEKVKDLVYPMPCHEECQS
ncbi:TetR/AcrR family transcriptional regulator [Vibrio japonicus]|uniref:TetR/AcrR family transcriptional regulator n=1 Tax=Vibrio japonicus TaxID=1824638 RepID=A0ABY5LP34_9VIBR|nr:TetR/AcrR family transcriptional regulator [Vibrio japonicus]UUM32646.1 TetR/AcrR family transcriptional regulator [Vibrio japonicus]